MKRTGKRVQDYAGRCARCGRLIEKGLETKFNGALYGTSCLKLAMANAEENHPDFKTLMGGSSA